MSRRRYWHGYEPDMYKRYTKTKVVHITKDTNDYHSVEELEAKKKIYNDLYERHEVLEQQIKNLHAEQRNLRREADEIFTEFYNSGIVFRGQKSRLGRTQNVEDHEFIVHRFYKGNKYGSMWHSQKSKNRQRVWNVEKREFEGLGGKPCVNYHVEHRLITNQKFDFNNFFGRLCKRCAPDILIEFLTSIENLNAEQKAKFIFSDSENARKLRIFIDQTRNLLKEMNIEVVFQ